ncbi:MAG: hypothetical protein HOV96_09445 [Nonomuraea sp.]|nr:hypothetical protein [Nonomuraea sp.]NUP77755.1 hypothetical protein [Nonomuraea sp.]NUS01490.1 hypothetical protein [Nonomuraea sp.]NUT11011.1 hypothetical protein [Nonomuraea sp.]
MTPEDELHALLGADDLLRTDVLLDAVARGRARDSRDPALRLLGALLDEVATGDQELDPQVGQRRSSVSMTPST